MNPEDFFTVIASFPRLAGAACKGRAPLFDPESSDQPAALSLCASCTALQACRAWFDSLSPKHRPEGVVAGIVHRRDWHNRRSTITEAQR